MKLELESVEVQEWIGLWVKLVHQEQDFDIIDQRNKCSSFLFCMMQVFEGFGAKLMVFV